MWGGGSAGTKGVGVGRSQNVGGRGHRGGIGARCVAKCAVLNVFVFDCIDFGYYCVFLCKQHPVLKAFERVLWSDVQNRSTTK